MFANRKGFPHNKQIRKLIFGLFSVLLFIKPKYVEEFKKNGKVRSYDLKIDERLQNYFSINV